MVGLAQVDLVAPDNISALAWEAATAVRALGDPVELGASNVIGALIMAMCGDLGTRTD
jgi:hypothetical protein